MSHFYYDTVLSESQTKRHFSWKVQIQGIIFFGLAMAIHNVKAFYTILVGLLLFDIAWVGLTTITRDRHKDSSDSKNESGEKQAFRKWAVVNAITVWAILISVWSGLWQTDVVQAWMLCGILFYRTVFDYLLVWDWYYPDYAPVPFPARRLAAHDPPDKDSSKNSSGAVQTSGSSP